MKPAEGEQADKCAAEIKAVLEKYRMEFHAVELRIDGRLESLEMKLFNKEED